MSARKFNGPQEFEELCDSLNAIMDEYQGAMQSYMELVEQTARSALDGRIKRFCENLGIGVGPALTLLREADLAIQYVTQENNKNVIESSHDIRSDLIGGFLRLEEQVCDSN